MHVASQIAGSYDDANIVSHGSFRPCESASACSVFVTKHYLRLTKTGLGVSFTGARWLLFLPVLVASVSRPRSCLSRLESFGPNWTRLSKADSHAQACDTPTGQSLPKRLI